MSNIPLAKYNKVNEKHIGSLAIDEKQIELFLKSHDMIVQWPINPFHTSAYEDLTQYVFPKDIEVLVNVIEEYYPEYKNSLKKVFSRIGISYLNMFIANSSIFDKYSEWLFDVLFKVEERIDISEYDTNHKRVFGYLSEVLLNVYIDYQ